jgi:glutathionyl-hydroquinone reductase
MMGTVMMPFADHKDINLYPEELSAEIDKLNEWIYNDIANGSYKAGFSSNQEAYEKAYKTFFAALQTLDQEILSKSNFLVGDSVTEADIRLFPPLFRFDPIYYSRFQLNQSYLWEYPNLWKWMSRMMALQGMDPVSNASYLQHCKQGYFGRTGNGTVPLGPPGYPECYKVPEPPFQKTAHP